MYFGCGCCIWFLGGRFFVAGTIESKNGIYYVNRKAEEELTNHLMKSSHNIGITAARQVGKSTTAFQASLKALENGYPVLYGAFSSLNGDEDIWNEEYMYKRFMQMFEEWINFNKRKFGVLNIGSSFKWEYNESGFDKLLYELKNNSGGKSVSIVMDELQCIRGDKREIQKCIYNHCTNYCTNGRTFWK